MPCRIVAIAEIARRHRLKLIEDAACAIGSETLIGNQWHFVGYPIGDAVCFSFHPRKLLTTGDGGMITVRDPDLDARLRLLRQHGMTVNDRQRHQAGTIIFEEYATVGFNYRLTDLQAAIGRCQLRRLTSLVSRRRELAELYRHHLRDVPVTIPGDNAMTRTNWQSYCVILPPDRDQRAIMQQLLDAGISTRRGVMCAHREPAYLAAPENAGYRFPLPVSESIQDHGLILPLFPAMQESDVVRTATALRLALARTERKSTSC
jgi:dTDP-4-amino-4,6-dideoxygalactose transaminase